MRSETRRYVPKPLPHRRRATVSSLLHGMGRITTLRMTGRWIEACGLAAGSRLDVLVEPCRITLTLAPAAAAAAAERDAITRQALDVAEAPPAAADPAAARGLDLAGTTECPLALVAATPPAAALTPPPNPCRRGAPVAAAWAPQPATPPPARGQSAKIDAVREGVSPMAAPISLQYVTDETGEPTGVIVPIDLWREMLADTETAHLLKSEPMRQRLLAALGRDEGIPFEAVRAKLGV
jgi:hypothetical protein